MDPLSIVGSVVGLSTAIKNISAGVRWVTSLKNAPLEFFDLQNELETVQGYLDVLRRTLEPLAANADGPMELVLTQIATTLRILKADVESLQDASRALTRYQDNAQGRVHRIKWKYHLDTVMVHRNTIRRRRIDLAQAVGLLQPVQSHHHATLLLNVQQVNQEGLNALRELINNSTETLQASIDQLSAPPTTVAPITSVNLDITVTAHQRCPRTCRCRCHTRSRIESRIGSILAKVVGQYFLSYSSIPLWDRQPCDGEFPRCKKHINDGTRFFELHYIFPPWLVHRSLALSVAWGSLNDRGASIHLSIPRVLPRSHIVWPVIQRNDVTRLQTMLSLKEIYPTDVTEDGSSLLNVSLQARNLDKVQHLLLSSGGALFANSNTSNRKLWLTAYRLTHNPQNVHNYPDYVQTARKLLALWGEEVVDNCTPVHEILTSRHDTERLSLLEDAIRRHPECLNVLDGAGYAPLHWAAVQNDVASPRLLLDYGADLNVRDTGGVTPLITACGGGHNECGLLLIEHGADVNVISAAGNSAVMASAMGGKTSSSITAALLAQGADPSIAESTTGYSALHYLCDEFSNPQFAAESTHKLDLILDAGADIDQPDFLGRSALLRATEYRDFRYITLLLQRGADVGLVRKDGKGLLHLVALEGTAETMKAIRLHHSSSDDNEYNLDPNLRDNSGSTAPEYFKMRVDAMPQLPALPGASSEPKESFQPISQRGIEEWVMLIEDLQSCTKHVHTTE